MRLWHKDLINVLPRQQLCGQWRECCLIAKNIAEKGTPNHILVNKIIDYPIDHFMYYVGSIYTEMLTRGYNCTWSTFEKYKLNTVDGCIRCDHEHLFKDWHNNNYLTQCYYNLQEKHDRGGITDEEWKLIDNKYRELISI